MEAIAIKDNKILAIGTNGEIEKLASDQTKRIDLKGKTVVPGFNDAHDHPAWFAPVGKFLNKNAEAELNVAGLDKKSVLDSVALMLKDQQNAQAPVWISLNESDTLSVIKGLKSFVQEQLSADITSVQYIATGFTQQLATDVFPKVNSPPRIRIIAWQRSTFAGRQTQDWPIAETNLTPHINISGVKYVIDGTPMEGNSLHKKASLQPGEENGRLNYPIDTMRQIFKEVLNTDRQLMMHITADSSFAVVLSILQQTASGDKFKAKRIRVEHNCVGPISEQQQEVLKAYNILMMHIPKYCQGSPLRSLYDNGVLIGISPDGTTNPFLDIMMCTTPGSA